MIAPMRKGPLYILVSNKELSSVLIFGQEKKTRRGSHKFELNEENTIEKIDKYIFIRNHIQKVKKVYNERGRDCRIQ